MESLRFLGLPESGTVTMVGWLVGSQIATVPSKFATAAPSVCNALQCEGCGRGINGTISVSGTETGWRGRQSFEPARNDTK